MYLTYLSALLNVSTLICLNKTFSDEYISYNQTLPIFGYNSQVRWNHYCANRLIIDDFNKKNEFTFKLGVNDITDMSYTQFLSTYMAYGHNLLMKPDYLRSDIRFISISQNILNKINLKKLPKRMDYRHLIGKPVNQNSCGSCYAHAAYSVISASYAMVHDLSNHLFSVQYYLDCGMLDLLPNCLGGTVDDAIYFGNKYGLVSEIDYPYNGNLMQCQRDVLLQNNQIVPMDIDKYFINFDKNTTKIKLMLNHFGPVMATLAATDYIFQFYKSGVINRPCESNDVNHYVTIVGYDQNEIGQEYWIVRNSFGPNWGEEGHFRILMGKNLCGIEDHAIAIPYNFMNNVRFSHVLLSMVLVKIISSFI